MTNNNKIKMALVCARGGHFEQMTNLSDFYNCYEHFWITNPNKQTKNQLRTEKAYFIELAHFTRPWSYLFQIAPAVKAFAKEKPTHVLSTGSGMTAFIPYVLAKLLKVKFIHIDTFSRVNNHTKFGSFMLRMGNRIYTQWKHPRNENAIYIGPVFKKQESRDKRNDSEYVFVTVGTRDESFIRLIRGVEDLVKKGVIREKVIIQMGHTKCSSDHFASFDFCDPEKIDDLILNARYVITQESAGIGTQCLKNRTRFIVMPRDYQYGELPAKSDMKEDLQDKLEELGYTKVVRNVGELEEAIKNLDTLKIGFEFNNNMAISYLHKAMEEA